MIQFKRPDKTIDYETLSVAVAKTIIEAVCKDTSDALSNAVDAVTAAFGEEEQTTEAQAYRWMYAVLAQASVEFLTEPRLRAGLTETEVSARVDQFLQTLPDSGQIAPDHLIHPAINTLFEPAIALAPDIAKQIAPENDQDPEELKTQFCRALSDAAGKVFASDPDAYAQLSETLKNPLNSAAMREIAWRRHANWIRQQYTQEPIFSPDSDEIIPLSQVYLRNRCYWHTEVEVPQGEGVDERPGRDREEPDTYRKAHLRDLHTTMRDWLDQGSRSDQIRVVAGGPGCGKSSFARAFASEVIDRNQYRVIMIPLQRLRITSDLTAAIGQHLTRGHHWRTLDSCRAFPQDPLTWHGTERKPFLFIFDGLDEMSSDDTVARDISRDFILSLQRMLSDLRDPDLPIIRAIVLGRSTACQDALRQARLPIQIMLNVARITPLSRTDLELPKQKNAGKPDLDAEAALLERDDRERYWNRWRQVKRIESREVPEAVTNRTIQDLNAEPLLLHLLIISDYIGDRWQEAANNPNLVYRDILGKIHDRNRSKERGYESVRELTDSEFFTLMECLGLAAWRGNGRTGTAEEFRELRKKHARREKRFARIDAAELKTVALQIHTRKGSDDEGFEFIHKSFGEYLAARALISAACRLSDRMNNDALDMELVDAALEWADIINDAELTPFILTFLKNEAKLTFKSVDPLPVKSKLESVLGWIQQHGIPVHRANTNASFRTLERLQRRAESAMIVTATAITSAAQTDESPIYLRVPWPHSLEDSAEAERQANPRGALRMFHRLGVTNSAVMAQALEYLDLGNQMLSSTDLSGADLFGANLSGADLFGANLFGANLFKANLREADLSGADLFGANLFKADLREANLREADLREANLREANLSGADLFGANLRGADLREADLREANLRGADLFGANLFKADLRRADLYEANFSSALIESCDLKFVNLSTSMELTQEQINSAKGSKKSTKLPEGLEHPDHWSED